MKKKEKDSRDIIQSYMITTARYKFSPTEKRIMYRIIEAGQDLIEGRQLRGHIQVQRNLLDDKEVSMRYSDVGAEDNHRIVRQALLALMDKKVIWDKNSKGGAYHLIERAEWNEQRGIFSFRVPALIWDAMLLQFQKGYRKYQLATAMSFNSVFSMRIYELISGQKTPLSYKISTLKEMLGIAEKYPRFYDLKKRVLNVAKKELDNVADYGFDYIIKGTKDHVITFLPYPIHRGTKAELNRIKRDLSVSWYLPDEVRQYLQEKGFTQKEIKTHLELFRDVCCTLPDPLLVFAELIAKSREKDNPKGYVINALRGKVEDAKKREIK